MVSVNLLISNVVVMTLLVLPLVSVVLVWTDIANPLFVLQSLFPFSPFRLTPLVESLTISVNNITLSQVQSYNFLYNTLFDLEGGKHLNTV